MSSNEELKHIGFVKLIEVKVLVMLSNIYGFFKDNSRCLKEGVVSVETKVISILGPVNEKLKILCEYKLGFIDDKFDKYAPTFIKNLFGKLNSCIKETISYIEEMFGTLVNKARTLIEKGLSNIESLIQKCIDAKKSVFNYFVDKAQSILEKGLEFSKQVLEKAKTIVGGFSFIGETTQSIIITRIDMVNQLIESTITTIKKNGIFGTITLTVKELVKEVEEKCVFIIQKEVEYISIAFDTTFSVVGGIPIIGGTVQTIITKEKYIINQLIHSTTSSISEYGIFGTISSATEQVVKGAQETGASFIQKGSESISQALDTTKSVVGGIPIIGGVAQSIITKQTDMASQLIENTTSSIKENGIYGAINSATEHVVKEIQGTGASIIQKGSESASQALDATKSVVGGIPIIGGVAESIITKQTDMASQLLENTTSSIKEKGIFGAIASATEHVIKEAQETGTSIIQKGTESASQALDTTKSIFGSIPIIGDTAQSVITQQSDKASQLIENTTSSIKEKGIFGAITSAVEHVAKEAQDTSTSIIQKGTESASQALDTTKSIVGSIPIIGDTAQSVITQQSDKASQLIESTTSSIKEKGIFGAITSAVEHVAKEAQETSTSIVQKGTESASQALDTTKSIVGSIPFIGDKAQSIIEKQTNMANDIVNSTTSSYKENGIFGAISSITEHVVNEAQETGASIVQKGIESTNQALDTTKSVVGGIPIIGNTAESIITKQTDAASQLLNTATSSVKENGIFGAISAVTDHVVKEAQATTDSIIQKSSDSVNQALETTKSVVGGIPIIGSAAQSSIDVASKAVSTTTSSVKKKGLFGSLLSLAKDVVEDAEKTTKAIIQKSSESVNKAVKKNKSKGGLFGNLAHSMLGN